VQLLFIPVAEHLVTPDVQAGDRVLQRWKPKCTTRDHKWRRDNEREGFHPDKYSRNKSFSD